MKWKRSKKGLSEIKQASSAAKVNHDIIQQRTSGNTDSPGEDKSSHPHSIISRHHLSPSIIHPGSFSHTKSNSHSAHLLGYPSLHPHDIPHLQQHHMRQGHDHEEEMQVHSDMDEDDFLDVENNNSAESTGNSTRQQNENHISTPGKFTPEMIPEDLSKRRLLMTNHAVTAH